jgi:hypothetical protein
MLYLTSRIVLRNLFFGGGYEAIPTLFYCKQVFSAWRDMLARCARTSGRHLSLAFLLGWVFVAGHHGLWVPDL